MRQKINKIVKIKTLVWKPRPFRILETLTPGLPMEYFDLLRQYLQKLLHQDCVLMHECQDLDSVKDHSDPFTLDEVDMGFLETPYFLELLKEKNQYVEFCKAAPLYLNVMSGNKPYRFCEIIVHSDKKLKYKSFHDLMGFRFVYDDVNSLCGCFMVLSELNNMGTDANFFGTILQSGSNLKSIEMIVDNTADVAAVDSIVLSSYKKQHPDEANKLFVLKSLGPIPIYPIVFNKRLSGCVKKTITNGLLDMNKKPDWKSRLLEFDVNGFVSTDLTDFEMESKIKETVISKTISPTYY